MKLTLPIEKFKKGVDIVSKIPTKKISLPILENVLFETQKNFLILCSTDLESGIFWKTLSKTEKEGKICINKKFLENFATFLDSGVLEIEKIDSIIQFKSENFATKLKGENPEEFPIVPQPKEEEFILINSKLFSEGISKVFNLPSLSLGRPEISGVLINIFPNEIRFVATDSFRLGEKKIFQKFDISKPYSLIIPQLSAKEIFSIFSKEDREIKVYFSPTQIFIETQMIETPEPEIIFTSRLIDGEYPNYEEIIPKKFETEAIIKTNEFLKKIKTASLFSSKLNEVKLKFLPKEKKIEILSENPDLGEFKSEITSQIKGKEMTISFNYKFLLDGITSIEEENFSFSLTNPEGPAMLKPIEDQTYYYLLMPIKTS